nr:unnamed protein product [Callosobruchus chinensis]
MRSPSVKADKNPKKEAIKYSVPRKKKRMADVKPPVRDTVSETISFVIKGKLTPIKPILMENKLNLLAKVNRRNVKEGKVVKKQRAVTKQTIATPVNKKQKQSNSKVKNKVQTKTAKKSALTTSDKKRKILIDVISQTPKNLTKRTAKTEKPIKIAKKAPIRDCKPKKIKKEPVGELPKAAKKVAVKDKTKDKPTEDAPQKDTKCETPEQETKPKPVVKRKRATKVKCVQSKTITRPKKVAQKQKQDLKVDKPPVKVSPLPVVVKTEVPSPPPEDACQPAPQQELVKIKVEPEDHEEPVVKKRTYKKLKIQPKIQIVKKRVKSKNPDSDGQVCKTKLFGFWNGPKRHRVASLNALAKVQCLYDNEGKGNLLDLMEEQSRMEYLAKVESLKLAQLAAAKKEPLKSSRESTPEPPTRTLRSVPGLRAVGKHWEHSDSSSSSDESDVPIKQIKQEKEDAKEAENEGEKQGSTGQKKKRGKNELVMDLKDMVVRKRMASLNATAILAASYSTEKRQTSKSSKNDDTSSDESGSSEEYFAANRTQVKEEVPEDDGKKEEDRKLVEVHATPNKKVAVILNHQDTADVTITGVYVNSTTRSTRHEGYCSIAGMQYRISATSHTQTAAAAAVATAETLLRSGEATAANQQQQENVSCSLTYFTYWAL